MSELLRVLHVEDSEADAAMVARQLKKAGYGIQVRRVQDAGEMQAALAGGAWDVVVADHHLPHFDARAALAVLHETGLDIPFIVVSGAIGEDLAVAIMKSGAHDYILKSNLTRLAAAVEREVREARARQDRLAVEKEYAARQRLDEQALRESNARLLSVLESITDGFFTLGPDWRFTYMNSQAERLLRRCRQAVLGANFLRDFPEPVFHRMFQHAAETKTPVHFDAYSALFAAWLEVHAYPSAAGVSVYVRDITERRHAEERIRRSLQEKEVLLREVHHRVKNNLQVICSMLHLQARSIQDPAMLQVLKDCGDRVQVMALLHEQLHGASDLTTVNLGEYLRKVVIKLFSSYGVDSNEIRLSADVEEVQVPTDTATACGMIIQELVSNALKHAFPQGRGSVTLCLHARPDGRIEMRVRDDGPGFSETAGSGPPHSLGLRLVQLFAEQIEATVERPAGPGTEYRLSFQATPPHGTAEHA
jgi:two-component sensor histidine kinase/FixJ family two-component response regulator